MIFSYLIASFAGFLSGITESTNKNITEKRYSVFSYAFIQWGACIIFYIIPFFMWGFLSKQIAAYIYLGLLITIVFIGNISLIKAYKTEDISNITILSQISLVIAFLSGTVFLHEATNIYKILGIILIIIGIIVIFYEGKKIRITREYILSLMAGISFGLTSFLNKKALVYLNPISLVFLYNLGETVLLMFIPKSLQDLKPIFQKYKWKILVSRIASVSGIYLYVWALQYGKVSIINTNYQTVFLLSSVLIGIVLLNEKGNIAKKLTGSLLCSIGIILLNFF